jgi:DNA-binding CsgD family transcriptional regulator/predicted HD phosphohydrolase
VRDGLLTGRAFVGRAVELAAVAERVGAAAAGRAGSVWIEGEAGSGKTALVRRVLAELPSSFNVLRAEADELTGDEPLAVVSQLGPLSARDPFAAGMELLQVFNNLQDAGPVVVVVEDLHWADVASRQALLTAARRLDNDRVAMVLTSRPQAGPTDGWDRLRVDPDRCDTVVLGALSDSEVAELAELAGVSLTRRDVQRLHEHTKGHPLYVRTLLNELTPERLAAPDGDLPAPQSLASTTIARLAELPGGARALVSALAVLNGRVPLVVVGRVGSVDQPAHALESLLATEFVTWWPGEAQTPIEFSHPLYRTAVYDDLSPTRRQELHRAAARALDAGAALEHRVAATDSVDDELADEIEAAARRQRENGGLALAARYLLWASSLSSQRDQLERRLLEAVLVLLADGQTVRADTLVARVEACQEGPRRSLVLGRLAWDHGEAATAERWLLQVPQLADEDGPDREVLAAALVRLGIIFSTQGRAPEALATATRALSLGPVDRDAERVGWTALALGEGMLRGAPAGLTRLAGRLPQAPDDVPAADSDLLVTRGTLGYYAGRTTAAATDLRAVVRRARQGSATAQLPRAHLHLSQLSFNSGDWDEASVHAHVALSLVSDERQMWMEAQVHAALGGLLASRGEWDAAAGHVAAARESAAALGTFEALFTSRIAEAALARARDDPNGVVDALGLLAGHGDATAIPMFSSLVWWPTLIVAVLGCGDVDAADLQVGRLEQAAQARGLDLRARIVGLRARVALARGDPDEASSDFEWALARSGADDPLLDRALLHHDFGRLLNARGNRREALDHLRAAHQLLVSVAAEPYRRRVEADLEACGIRSNTRTKSSPLALTDRETDVVALVAKGMTNREVAAQLYISGKAVEYHLRNVYGKLGIKSRRELRSYSFDDGTDLPP